MNSSLFKSSSDSMPIKYKYHMTKRIPQQLDSSCKTSFPHSLAASKYLDEFSTKVQEAINILNSASPIL